MEARKGKGAGRETTRQFTTTPIHSTTCGNCRSAAKALLLGAYQADVIGDDTLLSLIAWGGLRNA